MFQITAWIMGPALQCMPQMHDLLATVRLAQRRGPHPSVGSHKLKLCILMGMPICLPICKMLRLQQACCKAGTCPSMQTACLA